MACGEGDVKGLRTFAVLSLFVTLILPSLAGAREALTLSESVRLALERSPTLKATEEAIREADYRKRAALSAFFPQVQTQYSYTRLDERPRFWMPSTTLSTPMGPVTIESREMEVGPRDNYLWSTTVTQPLFTGGALWNSYLLAKLGVDVARWEFERVKLDLALKVKEAYWGVVVAEQMVRVAEKALESLKEHHRMASVFYEQGMIPKNDLLQVEVELAQREQVLLEAKNGLQMAKAVFNTLLRRGLDSEVRLAEPLKYEPLRWDLKTYTERALAQRPELEAARLAVQMAKREVKVAASGLYPQVSLLFNYQRQGDEPSVSGSSYNPDEESWSIMAVVQWKVWDWGQTWWRVKEKKATVFKAERNLEGVRDRVKLEVKKAYLELTEASERVKVAEKVLEQAEENFRMNQERYRHQVATSSDVLDALTLLVRAETSYWVALSQYNIARARLERAMGEM